MKDSQGNIKPVVIETEYFDSSEKLPDTLNNPPQFYYGLKVITDTGDVVIYSSHDACKWYDYDGFQIKPPKMWAYIPKLTTLIKEN